jgi:hypothetical protein
MGLAGFNRMRRERAAPEVPEAAAPAEVKAEVAPEVPEAAAPAEVKKFKKGTK